MTKRVTILLHLFLVLLWMEQFMPHFTMCHDALMTAWWQIGVGYTTKLNVSMIKLVSSLLLIQLFVL
jgi:hypothetical protein